MKTRRNWIRAIVGLTIVGFVCLGILIARQNTPLLMDVAHPVMKVNKDTEDTYWIAESRLLIISHLPKSAFLQQAQNTPTQHGQHCSADLLDIKTGKRNPLEGLTALLEKTKSADIIGPFDFTTSPDGVWILWINFANQYVLCASHLDGSHYRQWSGGLTGHFFFPDDRHLIQVPDEEHSITIRDLIDPTQDRKYTRRNQAMAALKNYNIHKPDAMNVFDAPDEKLGGSVRITTSLRGEKLLWLFPESARNINDTEIALPQRAKYIDGIAAPQLNAIGYYLQISQKPALVEVLHRIFPKVAVKPTLTEGLWVSNPDGHGMHEIGHVPSVAEHKGLSDRLTVGFHELAENPNDQLHDIRWLPGGKQISFVYHGTLYVVPAFTPK